MLSSSISPSPPQGPLTELWYGLSPSPPPHDVADWGGYTPVPASATLPDRRMCTGYSGYAQSSSTLAQCRASCDSSSGCAGFSWGLNVSSSPSPPPPSPSPPPQIIDRRRTLLAHDEPAVANVIGSCYLMTSTPTSSSDAYFYFTSAGCYAKSARLPPTWLGSQGRLFSGATSRLLFPFINVELFVPWSKARGGGEEGVVTQLRGCV